MARIRSVHPDICVDEVLAEVSARAERTFVRLWTHLDDEGRCLDHPKLLKAALYPLHDDMTPDEVDRDLWDLVDHGLLLRYETGGKRVIAAKQSAWRDRQKPKHPTESKLPGPPEGYTPPTRPRGDISPTSPPNGVSPTPGVPPVFPGSGEDYPGSLRGVVDGVGEGDGGGEELRAAERPGNLALVPAPVSSPPATVPTRQQGCYPPDFLAWWELYPRKQAKAAAARAWPKALAAATFEQLIDGLRAACDVWARGDPQYIPHPASWLNGRRWEDDLTTPPRRPSEPRGFTGIRAALEARGSA